MDLLHCVKTSGAEKLPDPREIQANIFGSVPDSGTRIEAVKWAGAHAAVTRTYGVDQITIG